MENRWHKHMQYESVANKTSLDTFQHPGSPGAGQETGQHYSGTGFEP